MSLFLFILESEEVKPHKVIFKPSILSDVAKNLVTSSSKGNYYNHPATGLSTTFQVAGKNF